MTQQPSPIRAEIARARSVIASLRSGLIRVSEQDTSQKLIMPMLEALGWDIRSFSEVREQVQSAGGGRADISCNLSGRVVMFVESKAINESVDDPRHISQAMKYGTDEGANWCILTNGRIWAIYHANAPGKAADKLFRKVDVTDASEDDHTAESLGFLAKAAMEDRQIDRAWKLERNDRQVETALRALLSGDDGFIRLLRKRIQEADGDLAPKDIREALLRLDIRVGITSAAQQPVAPSGPTPSPARAPAARAPSLDASVAAPAREPSKKTGARPKIADLIAAGLLTTGQEIRLRGRPVSGATVIDKRFCDYQGERMTYNDWGCKATGWTSINIYVHAETDAGVLLDHLRKQI